MNLKPILSPEVYTIYRRLSIEFLALSSDIRSLCCHALNSLMSRL
uniref:Uncharacterized protein n=1 Tax=Nelumbo nucifera TaxID=4432 RepID=A0A822XVV0_NELNU|nr:TPA_asm: hypothetical protein HUJ06_025921 [Nelumbo nucifera]